MDQPGQPDHGKTADVVPAVGTIAALGAGDARPRLPTALSAQITLAMVFTMLMAVVPLALFASWAVEEVNSRADAREHQFIQRAVSELPGLVASEQRSVTIWDDAVTRAREDDDQWLEDNLGVWLYTFFGHDVALVLDGSDVTIHAMTDGQTVPPAAAARFEAAAAPLIASLRSEIAAQETEGSDLGTSSVVLIDERPILISVVPIVLSSGRLVGDLDQVYVHVSMRFFDGTLLDEFGERYLVSDLRYIPAGGSLDGLQWVTLPGDDGDLGRIAWPPERPGSALIRRMAPGLAVTMLIIAGMAAALVARLRKTILRLHASEAQAQHLALHDVLTGKPNRALFDLRLDAALGRAATGGARFAVHSIDLDGFKNVNDTLGHPAGDALIQEVARRLGGLVRQRDTVARLGGDEFAIIQVDLESAADARRLADRILDAIRQPFVLGGDFAFVDSSIGTVLAPDFGVDRSELMRKADIALYEAKGSGKGRQCIFEAAMDEDVRRKRSIEHDLRHDLGQGVGLSVVYQPVYAIDGATIVGAEALVRWDHPDSGPISPALFIPVAEDRGLIRELGAWVLREACAAARDLGVPWVAVNVSAVQFRDPGFVDLVLDLLAELNFSPERLQLEITEGLLLDRTEAVGAALTKLRFAGVCIALDDFGTGYSSLRYLNRYKVDKIKIDQSFVQNLGTDGRTDAIVRAMIDLASALDLGVTAEGVETETQWRRLAGFGSPELQGYLFSRPITRAALCAMTPSGADYGVSGA